MLQTLSEAREEARLCSAVTFSSSLEGGGDAASRGMIAHDRIRLISSPTLFFKESL